MDDDFFYLFFNKILDLTAVVSITVKLLCIYTIIKMTPRYMRTVSYFILNEVVWTFFGNLFYTVGHPLPMMPATCFRMDGLAGNWLKTEEQRWLYFIAIAIAIGNCCLGFATTFIFRYVSLAFYDTVSRVHKAWGVICCVVAHSVVSLFVALVFHVWQLPISKYPKGDLPENTQNFFCYHPEGTESVIFVSAFLSYVGVIILLLAVFSGLSIHELTKYRQHKRMVNTTLSLQRKVLKNLLTITGTSVLLGGLPLILAVVYIYNSKLPSARTVVSSLLLMLLNFGTIYCVLILYLFKAYRRAVIGMIRSLLNGLRKLFICPRYVVDAEKLFAKGFCEWHRSAWSTRTMVTIE
uniref:G_PROTEIN_RECEP_F1_2 domain-containing protein n=1 Tax=Steinernema glaseri TaxID=37863 RepID=A0A1I8AMZ4_9BILA